MAGSKDSKQQQQVERERLSSPGLEQLCNDMPHHHTPFIWDLVDWPLEHSLTLGVAGGYYTPDASCKSNCIIFFPPAPRSNSHSPTPHTPYS